MIKTKNDFDLWFQQNFNKLKVDLIRKYPVCKSSIDEDLSDYYLFVIEKGVETINCYESYLYQFIYNKHFKYFSSKKSTKFMVDTKKCQIFLDEDINAYDGSDGSDESLEYEAPITHKVLDAIDSLSLDDKILYDLYFVQGRSLRSIGKEYNCPHSGIFNQITRLKQKIKLYLDAN